MKKYKVPAILLVLVVILAGCSSPQSPGFSNGYQAQGYVPSIENLENLQNSFRGLVQTVLPAVVKIDVVEVGTRNATPGQNNPFFEFFFGQPEGNQDQQPYRSEGLGSGVIVHRDGDRVYILTNGHVIGDATEIQVTLHDGREYSADLVGKDSRLDLALVVIRTNEQDIVIARLGDSDSLQVGDWVLAMGSPFGFQSTVTAGIVSALNRTGGPGNNISNFIQTDASINRGNSGGALVNLNGEVIGINTWITTQTGGSVGLGFAIPVNNVKGAIDDFINNGKISYGWLGVSIQSVSRETQTSMGLPTNQGALVTSVYMSSPAGRGGILPGDFITEINGKKVTSSDEVVLTVGSLRANSTAEFKLIRNGNPTTLRVNITSRESEEAIAGQAQDLWTGANVVPLSQDIRTQFKLDANIEGVFVAQVTRRSPAATAGIQDRDIITAINGRRTSNLREYYAALNSKLQGDIEFTFLRDGVVLKITIVKQ